MVAKYLYIQKKIKSDKYMTNVYNCVSNYIHNITAFLYHHNNNMQIIYLYLIHYVGIDSAY